MIKRHRTPLVFVTMALGILFGSRAFAQDVLTVGSVVASPSDTTARVPVYLQDVSGTAIGADKPAAMRITGFAFNVIFGPGTCAATASIDRTGSGGILAGTATPTLEATPKIVGVSQGYVYSNNTQNGGIPLTSDEPAPGDKLVDLVVTLSGCTDGTVIDLNVAPTGGAAAFLNSDGGTFETVATGGLTVVSGRITISTCPAAPVASNNGPICAGQTLQLNASTIANATYAWTGPNGFTSSQQNPQIPSAPVAASGTYSVTATVNGCTSPPGTTTAVVTECQTCTINPQSDIVVSNALGECGAVVNYPLPTFTGDCGVVTGSPASGSFFPVGPTTVAISSTSGATSSFQVTVQDTESPGISCPPNSTVSSDPDQCSAVGNPGAATVTDNCPGASVASARSDGQPLTAPYPVGTTTITWTATDASQNSEVCDQTVVVTKDVSISSNFNGTAVGANSHIWFNSALQPIGLGSTPVTIRLFHQTIESDAFTLSVPDATVILDPLLDANQPTATTSFTDGKWVTRVPSKGLAGNTAFLSGLSYLLTADLAGGLQDVRWSGTFTSDMPGVTLHWKWSAAVYSGFSSDHTVLGVKPVNDKRASQYRNSDRAGTPENFKNNVISGATGDGGANYTGDYSDALKVTPCGE